MIFFNGKKPFQMQENPFQDCGNNTEIARKLSGKFHFRIRISSAKFHIKVMKLHFKFKTGFERNCINKNVFEFRIFSKIILLLTI